MPHMQCLACSRVEVRQGLARFCHECSLRRNREQLRAVHAVRSAVARQELAPVRPQRCVDCAGPATYYDHRDYLQPLVVVPVCSACNKRRPPALDSVLREVPVRDAHAERFARLSLATLRNSFAEWCAA